MTVSPSTRRILGSIGIAAVAVIACPAFAAETAKGPKITFEQQTDRVAVSIDGKPFTEYVFDGYAKPILFPIMGPGGVPMTRSWPMLKDVADEPHDHPHHESLWFMHGKVNGVDFWLHKADKTGRRPEVRQTSLTVRDTDDTIESRNEWRRADGAVVMTDTRRIGFWADGAEGTGSRGIDYDITLHADHGPVVIGETKEGTMGIRVHHSLQVEDLDGSKGAAGRIVNSEGDRDAKAWGKPARWVDYSGPIEGRLVGIAVFDHPDNLRHPTRWHARGYGLFAANPFGVHEFGGGPRGAGEHSIPEGGSLRLRYRFVFHDGDAESAGIERRWQQWTKP